MSAIRRLLPVTIVATYGLILLGIYTAAVGAGLACDARWPLCDGAVFGLFPANWPSFIEWFHRLVAMVVGLMIMASWWLVWRERPSRRSVAAMSLAAGLLPVQIWLGAETVFRYELFTLAAHFVTALIIFTGLLLAGTWTVGWRLPREDANRLLVAGSFVLFSPFVALTPQFLVVHSGAVQVVYYGLGLAIFAALLVVTAIAGWSEPEARRPVLAVLTGTGTVLLAAQLLAGRLVRSPTVHAIDWIGAVTTALVLAVATWLVIAGRGAPEGKPAFSD